MAPVAADPTIRRQVMSAARDILRTDPEAPIDRITRSAGVSRATFYRHFHSRANLLASVAHEPRPGARDRILAAAQDVLVRRSLADLSMDDLASAADVSRGTLYRIFPGKPALMRALVEDFGPFDAIRRILHEHGAEPPDVVLPLIAREIVGVAGTRFGLMRAVFYEATMGSALTLVGAGRLFSGIVGEVAAYLAAQMAAGRVRRMAPVLALQAFIGPIFFHLMTRPLLVEVVPLESGPAESVDALVTVALAGLRP
jgi:AcrR family transcriptional regulator